MIRSRYLMPLILCCILPAKVYGNDITEEYSENEQTKRAISIDSKDSSLVIQTSYLWAQITSSTKKNWKKWAEKGAMPLALVISIGLFWKMRQRVATEQSKNHTLNQENLRLEAENTKVTQREAIAGGVVRQLLFELKVKNDIKKGYLKEKQNAEAQVEKLKLDNEDLQRKLEAVIEENKVLNKEKETMMPQISPTEQEARDMLYDTISGTPSSQNQQKKQPDVTDIPSTTPQAKQGQQAATSNLLSALGSAVNYVNPWGN